MTTIKNEKKITHPLRINNYCNISKELPKIQAHSVI